MNKKAVKSKVGSLVFWFILICSFVVLAAAIHLKANGWQINFRTWQLIKTGMISLDGTPHNAAVKLNGKTYSQTLPAKARNLRPGYYDVLVSAPNYQPWQKTIYVESGKVSIYQTIILFRQNPQDTSVGADITTESIKTNFQNQAQDLKIFGSEVYWQDKFITRFSQNIDGAILYPDKNHLIFQQKEEIRVIDIDGTNNQLLWRLSSVSPTVFMIKNNGQTIYYLDQDKILAKNII